ncbi:MAG: hypothetical protein EP329_23990 [Deltaproteobacteria bacterium]|nr:MAG: hypothetical protein EP329_23990 [Deltaproteobacteria bacterium]
MEAPLPEREAPAPATETLPTSTPPRPGDAFDVRRIVLRMIGATVAIVAVVVLALILFRDELSALSAAFVHHLGGLGIALGFALPDGFTLPLPNDAFTFFGYRGGIPFWECVAWGTAGSLVGGTIGFYIGRLLQRTHAYKRIMHSRGREVTHMVERYAGLTLLVAALTPIPYSIACWAVGAGGMRYRTFFLISLSRFFKVAFYLWLLAEGILPAFEGKA